MTNNLENLEKLFREEILPKLILPAGYTYDNFVFRHDEKGVFVGMVCEKNTQISIASGTYRSVRIALRRAYTWELAQWFAWGTVARNLTIGQHVGIAKSIWSGMGLMCIADPSDRFPWLYRFCCEKTENGELVKLDYRTHTLADVFFDGGLSVF